MDVPFFFLISLLLAMFACGVIVGVNLDEMLDPYRKKPSPQELSLEDNDRMTIAVPADWSEQKIAAFRAGTLRVFAKSSTAWF